LGVFVDHSSQAFAAAATARSTSFSPPRGTSAIASPVAGLSTSIVSPVVDSTHSPPTKFLYSVTDTLIAVPPLAGNAASVDDCDREVSIRAGAVRLLTDEFRAPEASNDR
jgi:hypothetical protein